MPESTIIGSMLKKALFLLTVLLLVSMTNIYSQDITTLTEIKTNDIDGISQDAQAPSINVTGIVTSTIELGTGTAGPGTIQDSQTGVAIYGSFFATDGGLKIGDSVIVLDVKVSPYNGLTELGYNSTSTVQVISSDHVVTPLVITPGDFSQGWNGFEKYESMLVTIKNVTFTDTAKTFSLNAKTGYSYHVTDGIDTVQFRIVKNTPDIIDQPIPTGAVDITGIVSQYCSSQPYNTGYEIFPLGASSIKAVTAVESGANTVNSFKLLQNYPNPFNPSTVISFELPKSQQVELSVYDLMGRKVQTLYNRIAPAGITNVNFKAVNLASGVYIYSLKTANSVMSKKLVLLK